MNKSYQDYCREAVARSPKMYGLSFNKDGTRKPLPRMSGLNRKKVPETIPKKYLNQLLLILLSMQQHINTYRYVKIIKKRRFTIMYMDQKMWWMSV